MITFNLYEDGLENILILFNSQIPFYFNNELIILYIIKKFFLFNIYMYI